MSLYNTMKPKFRSGAIAITPGALDVLQGDETLTLLRLARHLSGDGGDIDEEDKVTNNDAIKYGSRVLSAYNLFGGERIWIITEAGRRITTVLLPEEY